MEASRFVDLVYPVLDSSRLLFAASEAEPEDSLPAAFTPSHDHTSHAAFPHADLTPLAHRLLARRSHPARTPLAHRRAPPMIRRPRSAASFRSPAFN